MAEYKYRAFISYSHADEKWARWLHGQLESYRVPKRIVSSFDLQTNKLTPIFRDREELATSVDLGEAVTEALEQSESLIVLCSPEAAVSRWVNAEVQTFLGLGRGEEVQCIIVDAPPDAGKEALFPGALLEGNVEPLAADVRADGRHAALLKVIAGLIGISFDSLAQRDARRRQRRLATIATVSTAGMLLALTLAGLAWFSRQEALAAQARADEEAAAAEQVANFLTTLFLDADPTRTDGVLTAEEMLDRGAERLEWDLVDQPVTRARLLQVVGGTYGSLARHQKAEEMLVKALTERRRLLGPEHPDVAVTLSRLGVVMAEQGRYEEAMTLYEEALAVELVSGAPRGVALQHERIAALQNETRKHADAEASARAALESYAMVDDLLGRATALRELGVSYYRRGAFDDAKVALDEALEILEEQHGRDSVRNAAVMHTLVTVTERSGRYAESLALAERLTSIWDRVYGDTPHSRVADGYNLQAVSLWRLRRLEEAGRLFSDALTIYESVYGPDHVRVAMAENNLALVSLQTEDYEAAKKSLTRALTIYESRVGEDDPRVGSIVSNLGSVHAGLGRLAEAIELEQRALEIRTNAFGTDNPMTARSFNMLGGYYVEQQNFAEAERMLLLGLEIRQEKLDDGHPETGASFEALAELEMARSDDASARRYLEAALHTLERGLNDDHPRLLSLREKLASL